MSDSSPPVTKFKGQQSSGGMPPTTTPSTRMKVSELNAHLMCVLCSGYLVDATTIIECLHSYCRTCIVKYFEKTQKCPVCDTKVNKTKPLLNIRPDKTLQSLVYKVVPNLFKNEIKRRKSFYSDNSQASTSKSPQPDDTSSKMETDAMENSFVIFADDEHISLSLEYYMPTTRKPDTSTDTVEQGATSSSSSTNDSKAPTTSAGNQAKKRANGDTNVSEELVDKRFLRCPAAVSISHLKKFIRHKFSLPSSYQIEIMHKDCDGAALRDEYTLVDVAYIYHWKRNCQLALLYRVYEPPNKRLKFAPTVPTRAKVPTKSTASSVPIKVSGEHSKATTTTAATSSKVQERDANTIGGSSGTTPPSTADNHSDQQPVPMVL